MKPPSTTTPTPSIFSHSATAISSPPSVTSSRILTGTASPAPECSTPSAPSLTSPQTAAGSTTQANPKSCIPCSVHLPVRQAYPPWRNWLPPRRLYPPTRTACSPNRQADDENLIASPPNIKKRCTPLKTTLNYPG